MTAMWVARRKTWSRLWLTIKSVSPRAARCSMSLADPALLLQAEGRHRLVHHQHPDPSCTARAMATP